MGDASHRARSTADRLRSITAFAVFAISLVGAIPTGVAGADCHRAPDAVVPRGRRRSRVGWPPPVSSAWGSAAAWRMTFAAELPVRATPAHLVGVIANS